MSNLDPVSGKAIDDAKSEEENSVLPANLESLRSEIDEIDVQLTALLARRFKLTERIGKTKSQLGCKVKDEAREQKVLETVSKSLVGSNSQEFILSIFKSIINESVQHQETTNAADENNS